VKLTRDDLMLNRDRTLERAIEELTAKTRATAKG